MLSRRDLLALSAASTLPTWLKPHVALALADEDPTRVFTGDRTPTDVRLGAPKTLNDYFPFAVPKTKEAWETRRKKLREQLLVATGLWPMPAKTPLNPVIHGKIEREGVTVGKTAFRGYTIEKVFFASMPGHYVCGNLYRPSLRYSNPSPAVLFAHGHWAGGRFHDDGEKAAAASVKAGGEPDMDRGRYFMQALPATLARLGFVVFQYDMIGYADSTAIPHREGFRDAEAESRLQSQLGLQTWNSIRALDFLSSLADVDAKRVGMTGASGGGTQTFMLAAIDDRLASAFPAVMVSTAMQGGCVCENCSLLRVGTGNVEIAGLFAPKPQALSAANDWTKEMMTKGYPELQQLYDLYGAKDKVLVRAWLEYGHQYNVHARQLMYSWFLKHLAGKDLEVKEPPFDPVTPPQELSVFDAKHPRPKDELDAARLREVMTKSSDAQIARITPKDGKSLEEFRSVIGTALRVMVHSELPNTIGVRLGPLETKLDGVTVHRAVLGRIDEKDAVPTCGAFGPKFKGDRAVIWLHPKGKVSLVDEGKRSAGFKELTDAGFAVVAPDLLGTGENALAKPFAVDKGFAGYTYGYNRSLLANRVHDALTLVAFAKSMLKAKTIHIVGWGNMGVVAVLARALAGEVVAKTAADLNQFRFETIKDTSDTMMLPGAVKYGGLPAFLALCAPGIVFVHNHRGTASGKLARTAYEAAGAADNLTRATEKVEGARIVEWLLK
jgi:dienelactone hydrolase